MKKPVYKLLDEKGRILIPKEFRQMAELESGDIVKLSVSSGKIMVSKVDIVEMGSQDPQAVEAYVNAAVKHMSPAKQVALAARILKFAQQEGGTDCEGISTGHLKSKTIRSARRWWTGISAPLQNLSGTAVREASSPCTPWRANRF